MRGGVQRRVHVPPRHPPADSAETLRGLGAKPLFMPYLTIL